MFKILSYFLMIYRSRKGMALLEVLAYTVAGIALLLGLLWLGFSLLGKTSDLDFP